MSTIGHNARQLTNNCQLWHVYSIYLYNISLNHILAVVICCGTYL